MAVPTTRQQFKDYCLRRLGYPFTDDALLTNFIDRCMNNKYSVWYFSIIGKALERKWKKKEIDFYVENHHFFPKSLGGTDKHTVLLTAKEHFICHILLTKMLEGNDKIKMRWAVINLEGKKRIYRTSILYETVRKNLKHTEEAKQNMSYIRKSLGIFKGEKNPMYGKRGSLSPIHGRSQTEEHKQKRLEKIRGRKHSNEARQKMSRNRPKGPSGKKWFNNGIIETFGLPETKPDDFIFGRLKRA